MALVSDDGRWVTFRSHATNLVADDTNGQADIFVRDLDLYVSADLIVDNTHTP